MGQTLTASFRGLRGHDQKVAEEAPAAFGAGSGWDRGEYCW